MELELLLSEMRRRLARPAGASAIANAAAVGAGTPSAAEQLSWRPPDELPPWRPPAELFLADPAARLARFVEQAREGGSTVQTLPSRGALEPAVLQLLEAHGWRTMLCAAALRAPAFEPLLADQAATAHFGLCEAAAAVAELGSVMLTHDAGNPRSVSLVPPAVGFVVPASSIVSRITEVLASLDARGSDLPSAVTFVRGPSRSADIGSVTCFGAHGPGEVWVWIVEDE